MTSPRFFSRPRAAVLSAVFLFLLCLPVCATAADAPARPLPVIVSIAPQKYILERIAGNAVAVTVLVKPGADPHSYEPSPSQMRAVGGAAAWFTIGVPFEDVWLPRLTGDKKTLPVISSIKGIERLHFKDTRFLLTVLASQKSDHKGQRAEPQDSGNRPEQAHESEDPHVWLSPMLVRQMLPHLAKELGNLLPEQRRTFRANAKAFADELAALDAEIASQFSPFPPEQRIFMTFHPSWGYFAHNYQLTELAIEVDGKEPGAKTLKRIIDIARGYGIHTIFVEPQFSKNAAKAIADSIGAAIVEVDPLAENLVETYTSLADKLAASFKR